MNPAIRMEGLTKQFANLRAVDNLSLEVAAGSVFGFLGPNGAGKTTSIRLLLGLVEPSAGRLEVLGYAFAQIAKTSAHEQVRSWNIRASMNASVRRTTCGSSVESLAWPGRISKTASANSWAPSSCGIDAKSTSPSGAGA